MELRVYRSPVNGYLGVLADHSWITIGCEGGVWTRMEVKDWLPDDNRVCVTHDIYPNRCFGEEANGSLVHSVELHDDYYKNILERIMTYPHMHEYKKYPGPNSNTFIQWILNEYPEIRLNRLPFRCHGRNYEIDK